VQPDSTVSYDTALIVSDSLVDAYVAIDEPNTEMLLWDNQKATVPPMPGFLQSNPRKKKPRRSKKPGLSQQGLAATARPRTQGNGSAGSESILRRNKSLSESNQTKKPRRLGEPELSDFHA
jgi:hypothetical protein